MDHARTPPLSVRRLARRLLSEDHVEPVEPAALTAGFERVCQSLNSELGPLITSSAFHALLWRALRLAQREFALLERVTAEAASRCSFEAIREQPPGDEQRQVLDSITAVLAHLIWLLITLIGQHLTLRALRTARPDLAIDEARSLLEGSRDE